MASIYTEDERLAHEHLKRAVDEIDAAYDDYEKAKRYYDGDASLGFISTTIQKLLAASDGDNNTINFAAIPVDVLSDRIQLAGIQTGDTAKDDLIEKVWTENRLNLNWNQFIRDTLIYGDNYLISWPAEESVQYPDDELVEIVPADPMTTRVFYDDRDQITFGARKWNVDIDGKKFTRVNLYYWDRLEKYIRPMKSKKIEDFTPYIDPDTTDDGIDDMAWPIYHNLGGFPIFHFRTEGPYGTPEHKALFGIQDALNRIFQTHLSSIEFLGFPTMYALMDPTSAAGTSEFEFGAVDSQEPVTGSSGLKAGAGELWVLRAKEVGQFQPAGSENFITSLQEYKMTAAEVSRMPSRYFVSANGQHPGAEAINAADVALRQRVMDRQLQIGYVTACMLSFALSILGVEVDESDIVVMWVPQKLEITQDIIKEMEFKRSLGIPDYQILIELGYTDTQIEAWGITPTSNKVTQPVTSPPTNSDMPQMQ